MRKKILKFAWEERKEEKERYAKKTSELLKSTRVKHGLTQKALGTLLEVPERTLMRWERDGLPYRSVVRKMILEKVQQINEREATGKQYAMFDRGRIGTLDRNGEITKIVND